jgi:hypothetical protein
LAERVRCAACAWRVPVDPVEEIQDPVEAEEEDVVRGEVLDLAVLLHHVQLRDHRHCLQVDGEGPGHLERGGVVLVDRDPEQQAREDEPVVREVVELGVVSRALRHPSAHHVNDREREHDEDDLHDRVVDGEVIPEEIDVPRAEDEHVELLRLERDARDGLGGVDLKEQHEEREHVRQVAGEPQRVEPPHGCLAETAPVGRFRN